MATGLLALLDDVAALAKVAAVTLDDAAGQAAAASAKAAGIVIDDAAVTPRYVVGFASERELPIIGRIAVGSLKNKLVFLLPLALLLTVFAPWSLTPILMLGGLYLCFEGYEKVHDLVAGHGVEAVASAAMFKSAQELEDAKVRGAIRTDLVLSAEIMALTLASVTAPDIATKALVLAVVAVLVTAGVYGVVALIVKADDFGLYLAQRQDWLSGTIGRMLVAGMPPFLKLLALVGTVAMLWVGGGILAHGFHEFGVGWPEAALHAVESILRDAGPGGGAVLAWIGRALAAALFGLLAGALVALVLVPVSALAARLPG